MGVLIVHAGLCRSRLPHYPRFPTRRILAGCASPPVLVMQRWQVLQILISRDLSLPLLKFLSTFYPGHAVPHGMDLSRLRISPSRRIQKSTVVPYCRTLHLLENYRRAGGCLYGRGCGSFGSSVGHNTRLQRHCACDSTDGARRHKIPAEFSSN